MVSKCQAPYVPAHTRVTHSFHTSVDFFADMDGFKLLEHIGLELDLPVISERSFAIPGTDLSQHYGMQTHPMLQRPSASAACVPGCMRPGYENLHACAVNGLP